MTKKQQLIEGATVLFYKKGIHAVGINEVLKSTGIAKKTLYLHFASKEELVLACLQYRHERFINWFNMRLHEKQNSKAAIIHGFLGLQDWFNNEVAQLGDFNGCFFINTSAEFSDPGSPIHQRCCDHKNHIKKLFIECLMRDADSSCDTQTLSEQLCILTEGCISDARVRHNDNAPKKVLPIIEALLGQFP